MLAASACWSELSGAGKGAFGWSNRYGSSDPCVATGASGDPANSGALSSLNWYANVGTRGEVQRSTCSAGHAKFASDDQRAERDDRRSGTR